jgi:hypothetical protein
MITSEEIKSIVVDLGADKCGIPKINMLSSASTGKKSTIKQ